MAIDRLIGQMGRVQEVLAQRCGLDEQRLPELLGLALRVQDALDLENPLIGVAMQALVTAAILRLGRDVPLLTLRQRTLLQVRVKYHNLRDANDDLAVTRHTILQSIADMDQDFKIPSEEAPLHRVCQSIVVATLHGWISLDLLPVVSSDFMNLEDDRLLSFAMMGFSTVQAAEQLSISSRYARRDIELLYKKLGLRNIYQAANFGTNIAIARIEEAARGKP